MNNREYNDVIHGVLYDGHDRPYFVFTRTSTGPYSLFHLLAQTTSGKVFIIQKSDPGDGSGKQCAITMEDENGSVTELVPEDMREAEEGALGRCLATATMRTYALGPDCLPPSFWQRLHTDPVMKWVRR
jgi:hypothetical protein